MDWKNIFINELTWIFALEIFLRTIFMFIAVLVMLRISGKKGVRQLSIFEVAIIIALGSAAGDPMFNNDMAILPSLLVFAAILILYRLITWLSSKYEGFESFVEGVPVYVIENGQFVVMSEGEITYAKDELFAEMRMQSIEHIGQIRIGILETNGNISFYYFPDEEVRAGLPVLPKLYNLKSCTVETPGEYACTYCGGVQEIATRKHNCPRCNKDEWVRSIHTLRIK